ncbi:hypothetical protein [Micromonospora deserti]|uniref:hypothetical protein n=1 Tax=Micromonospora deserti TaxID=2070366 RepID=UPI0011B3E671|nr:hypothetical protein [Micromonospora deserti]
MQRMLGHASASMTSDVHVGLLGPDPNAVTHRLGQVVAACDVWTIRGSLAAPWSISETAKPRSLTWASLPSRLTESNRRPTHYEIKLPTSVYLP